MHMFQLPAVIALSVVLAAAQKSSPPTPPRGVQVNEIPVIGLGTARLSLNTSEVIASAIQNGYRHIDCAYVYGNQKDIGKGIKEGLKRTGLTRADLWITSKLGSNKHGQEEANLQEILDQLELDYLDLFLIHAPVRRTPGGPFDHVETWKAMEKLVRPTRGTRFIGMSSFSPSQVKEVLEAATIKPKVHQYESHPYLQQPDLIESDMANNMTVTAFGPLGNTNQIKSLGLVGADLNRAPPLLSDPTINEIAKARGCTAAQVVLAWNIRRGVSVIPKAARVDHQIENIATFDKCKLTDEDSTKIAAIRTKIEARFYENICKYGPTTGCSAKGLAGRAP